MTRNRSQALTGMTTRQKVIAAIFAVVLLIIIWQVIGLFRGSSTPAVTATPASSTAPTTASGTTQPTMPQPVTPQPAALPKPSADSDREAALIKLQQETQAKYIAALNELQALKVARDIAETNQAIASAKLSTVTSEKKIVDMLSPPVPVVPPQAYAQGLANPAPAATAPEPVAQPGASYTVVSVSQIQYRWSAVLGYQGSLYSVRIGDVLPPDGSTVVSIDKSGVVLMKDRQRRRVSLVPII